MKAAPRAVIMAAICAALTSTVGAQWPAWTGHPTPKSADGKPDMNAAAPRTPDGKPDFSGTWRGAPAGGRRGAPPPPPEPGAPPLATFRDIASTFTGGLPLTP